MASLKVSGIDVKYSCNDILLAFTETAERLSMSGAIKCIYYPLRNNDAVVILSSASDCEILLSMRHVRWMVQPLPKQIVTKEQIWLCPDLTTFLQKNLPYMDVLRIQAQVLVDYDKESRQLILAGNPFQIEMAQHYLANLLKNEASLKNVSLLNKSLMNEQNKYVSLDESIGAGFDKISLTKAASPSFSHQDDVPAHCQCDICSDVSNAIDFREGVIDEKGEHSCEKSAKKSQEELAQSDGKLDHNNAGDTGVSAHLDADHNCQSAAYTCSSYNHFPNNSGMRAETICGFSHQTFDERVRNDSSMMSSDEEPGSENMIDAHLGSDDMFQDCSDKFQVEAGSCGPQDDTSDYTVGRHMPYIDTSYGNEEGAVGITRHAGQSVTGYGGSKKFERLGDVPTWHARLSPSTNGFSAPVQGISEMTFKISQFLNLKIHVGDITRTDVDAVVNTVSSDLRNFGSVAKALLNASGLEMEVEKQRHRCKMYDVGEIVETKAYGRLGHMKSVLHVVTRIGMSNRSERGSFELSQLFLNCLKYANWRSLRSVAFPFIGSADVDVDGCVVAFVIAVLGYVSEAKDRRTSLADVRLVNGDENLVYHAIEVAEQCLLLESVESAADKFRTWRRRFGTGIHIFQESEALCRSSDYGGFRFSEDARRSDEHRSDDQRSDARRSTAHRSTAHHSDDHHSDDLHSDDRRSDDHHLDDLMFSEFPVSERPTDRGRYNPVPAFDHHNAEVLGGRNKEEDVICSICLNTAQKQKQLKCGHQFCTKCIDDALKYSQRCPNCMRSVSKLCGDQPENGRMTHVVEKQSLQGHTGYGMIVITYHFPAGVQQAYHPNPGSRYPSVTRTAYLPATYKGNVVLKMLQTAFQQRLTFTIGESRTTGSLGVITWNDIHHKTGMNVGPEMYGYPDPTYLTRVMEELEAKGIKA